MYKKRRYIVQIGGLVLNFFHQNLANLGKTIETIDVKTQDNQKKKYSFHLPDAIAFMGTCVFGNKIYISGGRKSFGQFILGEDDANGVKNEVYQVIPLEKKVKLI